MLKKIATFALAISGVAGAGSAAHAAIVGVQFLDPQNGFANNPLGASEVGGAPGYTQPNWNHASVNDHNSGNSSNFNQSGLSLVDSTGASTPITFGFTSLGSLSSQTYYTYPQAGLSVNERLMSDSVLVFGAPGGTMTFSNVPAGSYNVVVYTATQYPSAASFSVNGGNPTVIREQNGTAYSQSGDVFATFPNDTIDASNYLVLGGVTPDGSGNVAMNYTELGGTDAVVDAIQLVPASVPEPATLGLLGIACAMLAGRRMRRA